jgi:protein-S-isoprenylcysteine O-methyltransferase Ste14
VAMRRKQIALWATAVGCLIVALAIRFAGIAPANIRDFGLATGPLGPMQLVFAATPWVIFSIYWDAAAKSASPAKSAESKGSRNLHVVLTNAAVLLEIVQVRGVPRFLPLSVASLATGLAVSAIGLSICIWARRHLGKNWSGNITIKVAHHLVRTGPYRRLRHPIYTGILMMYAGTAVVSGSWLALAGLAMALFAYGRKLRLEEANLRIAFPDEYEDYRRRSSALIPGIY